MIRREARMQRRRPWAIWLFLALVLVLGVAGFALFILNRHIPVQPSWGYEGGPRTGFAPWLNAVVQSLLLPLTTAILGALISWRRPGQRIGALLMALAFIIALSTPLQEWAAYNSQSSSPGRGALLAAWITNWIWVLLFGLLLYILAIFPDGRFLSPRWRLLVWLPLGLFLLAGVTATAIETPMSSAFLMPNLFVRQHNPALYNTLFGLAVPAMPLSALAVGAAIVARFRQSRGRERAQMKWLLGGICLLLVMVVAGLVLALIFESAVGGIVVNVSMIGPLLGVGAALLRHQLYDIDVIIRRTLIYTALSAVLALFYLGTVVLLQLLFRGALPQQSSVAIVLSTLGTAALFSPLRRRIQGVIDRRFYRQKYDAAQALARFTQNAQQQVDLEEIAAALVAVVADTVQPEKVEVWLRFGRED
jgi:hypothetical protein